MRKTSAYARRRWQADPLASLRLLDRARPFDAGDTTVLPAERTAIVDALDAHEAITDASSPLQMYEALDVVRRSVIANMKKNHEHTYQRPGG